MQAAAARSLLARWWQQNSSGALTRGGKSGKWLFECERCNDARQLQAPVGNAKGRRSHSELGFISNAAPIPAHANDSFH
jgi:hypothetical protein